MKLTYETVNLLLLLMPGLLSSGIYNLLRRKEKLSTMDKIVEALTFSFLIYISLNLTYGWEPLAQAKKVGDEIVYTFSPDTRLIFLTLLYSMVLPIIWGSIVHYDLHMKLFRKMKITNRTSRDTVWDDVFTDETRFINIYLKDGRKIAGWPLYYPIHKDDDFLYICQAAWINEDNEEIETESHGFLISREMVELIEFMNDSNEEENSNEQKEKNAPN